MKTLLPSFFHLPSDYKKLIYLPIFCAVFGLTVSHITAGKASGLLINKQETPETSEQDDLSLFPGVYYKGSGYIGIYQLEDRFCYNGYSIRGGVIASVSEVESQPGVYIINGFEADRTLSQSSQDILFLGGSEYERIEEVVPLEQASAEVQSCLNSTEPYFYQEDSDI